MGELDPIELPRSPGGLLDQVSLELVARLEIGRPVVDPPCQRLGLLARQSVELGGHAVRDGIEPRPLFPFRGPRPGAFLSVPAIGFDLAFRTHGVLDFSKERAKLHSRQDGDRRGPRNRAVH